MFWVNAEFCYYFHGFDTIRVSGIIDL